MIAIGLTSGLVSISCTVLDVSTGTKIAYREVMTGPRKKRDVSHYRRYHAHKLMFEIIFDRWPPVVIALGPPSGDDEPLEWVAFMRGMVFELGKSIGVPVVLFDDDQALGRALGVQTLTRGNGLKKLIKKQIRSFRSEKVRVIRSTASAMAGARQMLQQTEEGKQ